MNSSTVCIVIAVLAGAFVTSAAQGQQSTERYIPLGESPGISASKSIIGKITQVDQTNYQMTVRGPDESQTVRMTDSTRYYLDRTKNKRSNQLGKLEYCKVGQRVEIKLNDDGTADWVKIEAD